MKAIPLKQSNEFAKSHEAFPKKLIDQDLVDENPGLAAAAGMPITDRAVIISPNPNEARALDRN